MLRDRWWGIYASHQNAVVCTRISFRPPSGFQDFGDQGGVKVRILIVSEKHVSSTRGNT